LCSEILEILKENSIYHCNMKGKFLCNSKPIFSSFLHVFFIRNHTKLNVLQTSYNQAPDWKQNTGAVILERDLVNGVKTVEGKLTVLIFF
jgi:hypothetical protein